MTKRFVILPLLSFSQINVFLGSTQGNLYSGAETRQGLAISDLENT